MEETILKGGCGATLRFEKERWAYYCFGEAAAFGVSSFEHHSATDSICRVVRSAETSDHVLRPPRWECEAQVRLR